MDTKDITNPNLHVNLHVCVCVRDWVVCVQDRVRVRYHVNSNVSLATKQNPVSIHNLVRANEASVRLYIYNYVSQAEFSNPTQSEEVEISIWYRVDSFLSGCLCVRHFKEVP